MMLMKMKPVLRAAAAAGLVLAMAGVANAADTLTIALSNGGTAWDFSVAAFGEKKGFFAEEGLHLEVAGADNASASLQAVIAGSADISNVSVPQFLAAGLGGAPVTMISSSFVGASDYLWYVKADSPIQSLKDLKETTTVGVTSTGSSSYVVFKSLLAQEDAKADIVAAGSSGAIITQVMTNQIDVGTESNGFLGVPQFASGEVRTIAHGGDLKAMHDVTVRGLVVSATALAADRDKFVRFLRAYQKTVDWMYSDPEAVKWFAERKSVGADEAQRVRDELYPKGQMDVREVLGLDVNVQQALEYKRIDRAPTAEEVAKLFDTPWKPSTM